MPPGPTASVIIPAHNEARTIGRLLDGFVDGADEFEIVLVCNGCTDDTASRARTRGASIKILELTQPSKHAALLAGDQVATCFPRLYVDADVEFSAASARALIAVLRDQATLAAGPRRELVVDRSSRLVRSYYRVWERLPAVRDGLYGRGVIGVSAEGHRRIGARPEVLGDDLYVHGRFAAHERAIAASSVSKVYAPTNANDLIKRRTRAAMGNRQLSDYDETRATTASTARSLAQLARHDPSIWPHIPSFVMITAVARLNSRRLRRARRSDVWLRDESSRQ